MDELKKSLRRALASRFGVRKAVDDDTALFSGGLIDSLSVIELVSYVEETAECVVPPEDITLENFDSILRIAEFVSKLKSRETNA
jgi:acyl carrier protein